LAGRTKGAELRSTWLTLSFLLGLLALASPALPQINIPVITIASSPSPVGSGARAAAFGSAFIAIADDATAASWNPGGLVQLERPEVSVVGAYYQRTEDFSDDPRAWGNPSNTTNTASLNYLSAAYPFGFLKRNMVVSINYQRILDFNRDLKLELSQDQEPFLTLQQTLDFEQRGSLNAISPAFCAQVTPRVSVGFAVNVWMDDIFSDRAWESHTRTSGGGEIFVGPTGNAFSVRFRRDERFSDFLGVNGTIGMLWKVWQGLQIGAVVKTPFRAKVDRELTWSLVVEDENNPGNPPPGITPPEPVPPTKEEVKVDFPWAYGIGAAYRFADRWCVSLDVTRVHWGDFVIIQTDPVTGRDIETSPFTGTSPSEADVGATTTVRAGTEYLFIRDRYVIPIRGGVFYDPLPAKDGPDKYYGFSLGSGVALQKLSFDLAYTFRYGDNVLGDLLSGVADTRADVLTHQFLFSVIWYF
jgi:long-subunit fatty acid transport protein